MGLFHFGEVKIGPFLYDKADAEQLYKLLQGVKDAQQNSAEINIGLSTIKGKKADKKSVDMLTALQVHLEDHLCTADESKAYDIWQQAISNDYVMMLRLMGIESVKGFGLKVITGFKNLGNFRDWMLKFWRCYALNVDVYRNWIIPSGKLSDQTFKELGMDVSLIREWQERYGCMKYKTFEPSDFQFTIRNGRFGVERKKYTMASDNENNKNFYGNASNNWEQSRLSTTGTKYISDNSGLFADMEKWKESAINVATAGVNAIGAGVSKVKSGKDKILLLFDGFTGNLAIELKGINDLVTFFSNGVDYTLSPDKVAKKYPIQSKVSLSELDMVSRNLINWLNNESYPVKVKDPSPEIIMAKRKALTDIITVASEEFKAAYSEKKVDPTFIIYRGRKLAAILLQILNECSEDELRKEGYELLHLPVDYADPKKTWFEVLYRDDELFTNRTVSEEQVERVSDVEVVTAGMSEEEVQNALEYSGGEISTETIGEVRQFRLETSAEADESDDCVVDQNGDIRHKDNVTINEDGSYVAECYALEVVENTGALSALGFLATKEAASNAIDEQDTSESYIGGETNQFSNFNDIREGNLLPEKSEEIIDAKSRDATDSLESQSTDNEEITSPVIATQLVDYLSFVQFDINSLLRNNVNVILNTYGKDDAEKMGNLIQQAFTTIQNIN